MVLFVNLSTQIIYPGFNDSLLQSLTSCMFPSLIFDPLPSCEWKGGGVIGQWVRWHLRWKSDRHPHSSPSVLVTDKIKQAGGGWVKGNVLWQSWQCTTFLLSRLFFLVCIFTFIGQRRTAERKQLEKKERKRSKTCNKGGRLELSWRCCSYVACTVTTRLPMHSSTHFVT